jgi:hypothetical protein
MVAPTKKNSPSIHLGNARNNKPAEAYEKNGTSVADGMTPMEHGEYVNYKSAREANIKDPLMNGVSYGVGQLKDDGIEMRGAGAATKGRKSRGPMA